MKWLNIPNTTSLSRNGIQCIIILMQSKPFLKGDAWIMIIRSLQTNVPEVWFNFAKLGQESIFNLYQSILHRTT